MPLFVKAQSLLRNLFSSRSRTEWSLRRHCARRVRWTKRHVVSPRPSQRINVPDHHSDANPVLYRRLWQAAQAVRFNTRFIKECPLMTSHNQDS
jgi:hypothetical protein